MTIPHPPLSPALRVSRSERQILDAIRCEPGVSRAGLASRLDLSQQTVHRLVERLSEAGLVAHERRQATGRGQPSPGLRLAPDRAYGLGVVINTDSVVLCLIDSAGGLVDERYRATAPLSRDQTLQWLRTATASILEGHAVPRERLLGAGVAIGAFFYGPAGHVSAPEPLHDWSLIDLRPLLEAALGAPVTLLNSASAAALGEETRGIGRQYRSFGYLHFHYGFGGGLVYEGRPIWGAQGNAGEIGVLYGAHDIEDRPALLSLLQMLRGRGVEIDALDALRERFDPSWPGVTEWINRVTPGLNRAIQAFAAILDPEAIIFGGAIPPALARLLILQVRYNEQYRGGITPPRPALLVSEIAGDAAASGAACVPIKAHLFSA